MIELLVVIAIIALLVSILLPSLGAAKRLAKRTVCISNLHHCGLALNIYANENNGRLFECTQGGDYTSEAEGNAKLSCMMYFDKDTDFDIREIMGPYIDDWAIWTCPATDAVPLDDPANTEDQDLYANYYYFPDAKYPQFGNVDERVPTALDRLTEQRWSIMQDWVAYYVAKSPPYWRSTHASGSYQHREDNPSFSFVQTPSEEPLTGVNVLLGDFSADWYGMEELEDVGRSHGTAHKQVYGLMP